MRSTLRKLLPLCLAFTTTTCKEGMSPTVDELVQMTLDFCEFNSPQFVAVRSAAGGDWVRVTGSTNGTFTLNVPESFALAVVYQGGDLFEAEVIYASRDDLAFLDGLICEEEPALDRTISGSAMGLTGTQQAEVAISDRFDFMDASDNTFAIDFLPAAPLDLVAIRLNGFTLDRMIVRRALSATATSTPVLDFGGSEAIAPATSTLTYANAGTDIVGIDRFFHSSLGTSSLLTVTGTSLSTASFTSVPAAQTVDGDMHELILSGFSETGDAVRAVRTFFRAPGDLTTTFGPHLAAPSVSYSGTPQRPHVQLTSQLDYGNSVLAIFSQGLKSIALTKTHGFDGATPALWDLEFPDLSGVSGFPGGGFTSSGKDWIILATNASLAFAIGDESTEGLIVKLGSRASFTTAASGSRPAFRPLRSHMRGGRRGW